MTFEELSHDFPRWHCWRSTVGLLYARRVNTSPARIVRAENEDELASQMEAHEAVIWRVSEKSGEDATVTPLHECLDQPYKLKDGGHSYWYDRP